VAGTMGTGAVSRDRSHGERAPYGCTRDTPSIIIQAHVRLNLKNTSAVSVVAAATSFSVITRAAAIVSATIRVCAGSERLPRKGTGARYGQSVSTINFHRGICAATSRTPMPLLKVTIPVNETT